MSNTTYTIPREIDSRIPEYFYIALAGELLSIFGLSVFKYDETANPNILMVESSLGWATAMRMTCNKLKMDWLWDYYEGLDRQDLDMFDNTIGSRTLSALSKCSGSTTSPYYVYIIENGGICYK